MLNVFRSKQKLTGKCSWSAQSIDPLGYAWCITDCGKEEHERNAMTNNLKCPKCSRDIEFIN
jgi:hypothetical protein